MIEKPMAMNAADAAEVEVAASNAGVTCMVGYSLRFSTGKYVHDLLEAGHVGDVQAVSGSIGVPPQTQPTFGYDLRVYGTSGDIGLRGRNLFQAELEVFSTATGTFRDPAIIRPVLRGDAITTLLVPELDEFAHSILESRPPAITAADGRRVLQVLDAVVESARLGQPVAIHVADLLDPLG